MLRYQQKKRKKSFLQIKILTFNKKSVSLHSKSKLPRNCFINYILKKRIKMDTKKRFILSGGGTGGHIFPAIAIADELKERFPDAEFLFVGAKDRMEMKKVPEAGYPIKGLWISGIQRKITLQNLLFPFKWIDSLLRSRRIIKRFKPDMVIGTGGFASGAVVKVAAGMGIPTVIQEQNSYAGITNKLLSKKAKRVCVAYEGMEKFFPANKIIETGNPIRSNLIEASGKNPVSSVYFGLNMERKTLLVLGGSLGARRINELIAKELPFFEQMGIQVLWQCGKLYYEEYKKYESESVKVVSFIDKMDVAYAMADVIISRAGAIAISELCVVGRPVIFIPSPNVAEDHQTKNAKAIESKGAALLIPEKDLDEEFEKVFRRLITNPNQLLALSDNIKKLARPDATKRIVDCIVKLLK
jgi:undecaprenyldiphospho-muramoylpentapeptide beta-N-acetylglucosaminyltransferase